MVLDDASSQNLFSTLMSRQTGETIQDFFNNIHNKVFNFKTVSEEDREELFKLLTIYSGDCMFNEFVLKYFNKESNAWGLKCSVQNIKTFPNISLNSAVSVLKSIYNHSQRENVTSYIKWLTFNITDFLQFSQKQYEKLHLDAPLFNHFVETEALSKYIKHFEFKPGFSLLSFICQQDDTNKAVIPALVKYGNVKLEWNKANSLNELFAQLLQNYSILNPEQKLKGFDLNGSIENAIQIFSYITPSWDMLSATFNLRKKPLPNNTQLSGGYRTKVSDSDVVRIFSGAYELVPAGELQDKNINLDVIADFNKFNQFPTNRKLQISHFLLANRKRFNDIVTEATQLLINNLRSNLNANMIASSFRNFKSNYFASLMNQNPTKIDAIEDDIQSFASKLYNQFKTKNPQTFENGIDFIVHKYIPMLRQFKKQLNENYGSSMVNNMLAKFNKGLNVIGIAKSIDEQEIENYLSGGSKNKRTMKFNSDEPKVEFREIYVPLEKPIYKTIERVTIVDGGNNNDADKKLLTLLNAFISGQETFNKAFEDLYKKLILSLNTVKISQVQTSSGVNPICSICSALQNIEIRNAKTTIYLSGFYGAKNYNQIYTQYISSVINTIENSGVSGFESVTESLKQLKNLLTNTYATVQSLRAKYINTSKTSSESYLLASKKIKIPCKLSQKDFNAFSDALHRIINIVRNFTSESSVYNAQQQTENYLSKISDREKTIYEHYDILIQSIKTEFLTYYKVGKERDYAKEIRLTIIQQIRDCLIYINKVFDVKLAKERMENLQNANLSQTQIENIERAYLSFRNVQIDEQFHSHMKKINDLLKHNNIGVVFKLIKRLRKLIVKSNYLQFIVQIYKELNLFSNSFNWSEFIEKYTNMIVLSSIEINKMYAGSLIASQPKDTYTCLDIIRFISKEFEAYLIKQFNDGKFMFKGDKTKFYYNAGYLSMCNFLTAVKKDEKKDSTEVTNVSELFKPLVTFGELNGLNRKNIIDKNFIRGDGHVPNYDNTNWLLASSDASLESDTPTVTFGFSSTDDDGRTFAYNYFIKNVTNTKNTIENCIPFYIKNIPAMANILEEYYRTDGLKGIFNASITPIDNWGIDIVSSNRAELKLAEYSIESLYTNVLAVMDKYWAVKYNGSLNIPININLMMHGGSIFDSMPMHNQIDSSIIAEAVPFYLCAFHICYYYINTFSKDNIKLNAGESKYGLVLTINKMSMLYPIYEIFYKYNASINSLTPQQLKISISVFNEIWNQTQGNEASKLSRSIDLLFSELNACFIFTDEIQLEIIKSTNSISKLSLDVINNKINTIVDSMKNALNFSEIVPKTGSTGSEINVIDISGDPTTRSKQLERILSQAYKDITNTQESQRFAKLKAILCKEEQVNELQDFYAFMELVISPLLICAKSYISIFNLFDIYELENVATSDPNVLSIDLSEIIEIVFNDYIDSSKTERDQYLYDTAWNLIQEIKRGNTEYKPVFIESSTVLRYNRLLLYKALSDYHKTGSFILPKFWLAMDESTYPNDSKLSINPEPTHYHNDNIMLIRQIYPNVQANTLADYYNHCVNEFIADYDHFIHAFVSYPGLSDKTIKLISTKAHDSIKITNIRKHKESNTNIASVYTLNALSDDLNNTASSFANVKIVKSKTYLYPPPPSIKDVIPRLNDINIFEELIFTTKPYFDNQYISSKQSTLLDGTGVYILTNYEYGKTTRIPKCDYTWLDWVVYNIAKCDKINFMLPYKFLQMIQDFPGLNTEIKSVSYNRKDQLQIYNRNAKGIYYSLITQNIIGRSSVLSNKEKTELSLLNSSWISNIVSIIPYLINTITVYKNAMDNEILYDGINVQSMMSYLIDILTSFYDLIGNFTPFIPFMSNIGQINTSIVKPHLVAEVLHMLTNQNLIDFDANDYVRIEWANKYFFNYIDNIQFPEYKNKDRFEWIKQFAKEQLNNKTFATEFETSIQILGKLTWAGLISNTASVISSVSSKFKEMDEIIVSVIHIMSECDYNITQQLINNIISEQKRYAELNNPPIKDMKSISNLKSAYKQTPLSGGNIEFIEVGLESDERIDFVKRITHGLSLVSKDSSERLAEVNARIDYLTAKVNRFSTEVMEKTKQTISYEEGRLDNLERKTFQTEIAKLRSHANDIANEKFIYSGTDNTLDDTNYLMELLGYDNEGTWKHYYQNESLPDSVKQDETCKRLQALPYFIFKSSYLIDSDIINTSVRYVTDASFNPADCYVQYDIGTVLNYDIFANDEILGTIEDLKKNTKSVGILETGRNIYNNMSDYLISDSTEYDVVKQLVEDYNKSTVNPFKADNTTIKDALTNKKDEILNVLNDTAGNKQVVKDLFDYFIAASDLLTYEGLNRSEVTKILKSDRMYVILQNVILVFLNLCYMYAVLKDSEMLNGEGSILNKFVNTTIKTFVNSLNYVLEFQKTSNGSNKDEWAAKGVANLPKELQNKDFLAMRSNSSLANPTNKAALILSPIAKKDALYYISTLGYALTNDKLLHSCNLLLLALLGDMEYNKNGLDKTGFDKFTTQLQTLGICGDDKTKAAIDPGTTAVFKQSSLQYDVYIPSGPIHFGALLKKTGSNDVLSFTGGVSPTNKRGTKGFAYIDGGDGNVYGDEISRFDLLMSIAGGYAKSIHCRALYFTKSNFTKPDLGLLNADGDFYYIRMYNPKFCNKLNAAIRPINDEDNYLHYLLDLSRKDLFITKYDSKNEPAYVEVVSDQISKEIKNEVVPTVGISKAFTFTNTDFELCSAPDNKDFKYAIENPEASLIVGVKSDNLGDELFGAITFVSFDTLINPTYHFVQLNQKMETHVPTNCKRLYVNYLLSPQKDIYNATSCFISDTHLKPSVLSNLNELPIACDVKIGASTTAVGKKFDLNYYFECVLNKGTKYVVSTSTNLIRFDYGKLATSNVKYNSIYAFIEDLLVNKLNDVTQSDNLLINNYGFKFTDTLTGGETPSFSSYNAYITSLVNINCNYQGLTAQEKLSIAYNSKNSTSALNETSVSKTLYEKILNKISISHIQNNNTLMFALIINYFHKFNLSLNSMINQLCFPSVLFNSACLRSSLSRIHEIMKQFKDVVDRNSKSNSHKYKLLSFIYKYLSEFTNEKSSNGNVKFMTTLDSCKYHDYQIATSTTRNKDFAIGDFTTLFDDWSKLEEKSPQIALGNQFLTPSISNTFMYYFGKYIMNFSKTDEKYYKDCDCTYKLFDTDISEAFRHIDCLTTFISVMIMLLKQTSYYNNSIETDVSYFNVESPEPFSVN